MKCKAWGVVGWCVLALACPVWAADLHDMKLVPVDMLKVPAGFEVTVFATTPDLYNPTNFDIDHLGRVWVAEGRNYRRKKGAPDGDRIAVLTDTDGDGKADKSHTFVQEKGFLSPLGVAVVGNKVIVAQPPDLLVYTDVDGDAKFDPAKDKRQVLLTGWGGKNHDHSLHSVTVGPNGQWYFNTGNAGNPTVVDKSGWKLIAGSTYARGAKKAGQKSSDGQVYIGGLAVRVNPDGTGLRVIGHNFRNSYEQTVTSFGDVFQNDNDDPPAARTTWLMEYGNLGYHSADGKVNWGRGKRPGQTTQIAEWRQEDPGVIPAGDVYGGGSPTGICYHEGDELGAKWRGLLLSCEPSRNVVFGYLPKPDGAGFKLERFDFITSNPSHQFDGADFTRGTKKPRAETLFRPSDVCIGPDGAIYVADWFDTRVGGHATHDKHQAGTIYRIAPKGRKLTTPKADLKSVEGLVAMFKSASPNVRGTAFYALKEKGAVALAPVKKLLGDPNPYLQARAIFLLAQLGDGGVAEVVKQLRSTNPQIRIAAFRALRHGQHDMLKHAAMLSKDRSSAVRREVALALRYSTFAESKAILANLAKGYDGKDRWYLEAFGLGCTGKEAETYQMLYKTMGGSDPARWTPAFAGIAWRLHPVTSVGHLAQRALAKGLPEAERKKAVVAIGFIFSPMAAKAMEQIKEKADGNIRKEAEWWLKYRYSNRWRDYSKQKQLVYQDHVVPQQLGNATTLPALPAILKLKGNAANGAKLVARCYVCHQIGDSGVDFGPNLSVWGRHQAPEVIAKAIVEPSADLSHGFEGEEIKTKDGKTIQGFVAAEGAVVVVKAFGGAMVEIDAKDIASRAKMKKSLMPPASKMGLTAQDVRDVVAYLKSGG